MPLHYGRILVQLPCLKVSGLYAPVLAPGVPDWLLLGSTFLWLCHKKAQHSAPTQPQLVGEQLMNYKSVNSKPLSPEL